MNTEIRKDCDEPFIGKLMPLVTPKGQLVKTFQLNKEESNSSKLKEVSELCMRLRLPGNPVDWLERKHLPQHQHSVKKLHKKRTNFICLMGLGHLHEGPNKKNRPTEFLDSIIKLSGTDIDSYKVGKEIFIEGMPPWIREKLRKLHENNTSMITIAQFADSLLSTELMDLPTEMLLDIVHYLRADTSILQLSKVCQKLYNLSWHGEFYTLVIAEDGNTVEAKLDSIFESQEQENNFWIYVVVCNCGDRNECIHQRKTVTFMSDQVINQGKLVVRILVKINITNENFIRKFASANSNTKTSCTINDVTFSHYSSTCNPCDNILFRDCTMMDGFSLQNGTKYCKFKRRREIEKLRDLMKEPREPMDIQEAERLDFAYHNELMDNHLLMIRFENQYEEEEDEEDYIPHAL